MTRIVVYANRRVCYDPALMETTLHRQLKALYATDAAGQEVAVDGFRIDALGEGRLVEIQYGSLGAIRDKVRKLVRRHDVLVVKPLAARKQIARRQRRGGPVVSVRYSPLRQTYFDLFEDLVHFVGVFPHRRLVLEVVLTEQEEHRIPARKRRRFGRDYRVEDRTLRSIEGRLKLQTAGDLAALLPTGLTETFTTEDIAREAGIARWLAQKMAYCLRKTGAVAAVAKRGNAVVYRVANFTPRARSSAIRPAGLRSSP
jgi:hypothetical protein